MKLYQGKAKVEYLPKAASTAFPAGCLVYANGTGEVIPADNTSGDHMGLALRTVTSADADYAAETKIPVHVFGPEDVLIASVPKGDLSPNDIGITCDLDDTDPTGIDPDATSKNVVMIVGYISASLALIKVNAQKYHFRVATT